MLLLVLYQYKTKALLQSLVLKRNNKGKNFFWFGFKRHLAVRTKSQYIVQFLFSSGMEHNLKVLQQSLRDKTQCVLSISVYVTETSGACGEALQ
ncbi:hypothetical protein [Paenisporosarcina sp. HGH0030]|uniref:hypothetical protein n=1 Tax=Paenisporosarcina sp. HGH0030 TaxID=1078085 RepID=UPI0005672B31|nr:hypothetical protein [Paenisporosarcina sp. HGH0030]